MADKIDTSNMEAWELDRGEVKRTTFKTKLRLNEHGSEA